MGPKLQSFLNSLHTKHVCNKHWVQSSYSLPYHRIREWSMLERSSGGHLVHPSCSGRANSELAAQPHPASEHLHQWIPHSLSRQLAPSSAEYRSASWQTEPPLPSGTYKHWSHPPEPPLLHTQQPQLSASPQLYCTGETTPGSNTVYTSIAIPTKNTNYVELHYFFLF